MEKNPFDDPDFGAASQQSTNPFDNPEFGKEPGVLRSAGDSAVALGTGVIQGVKMFSDLAGAGNAVSRGLESVSKSVDDLTSPFRKAERQERARKIQEAEATGSTWEEVKANVGSFAEAPLDTTLNALGTSAPTLAAAALSGGTSIPLQIAARAAPVAIGAMQGAGAAKGQIYEAVEQQHLKAGATPEQAAERAAQAQSYGGDNIGNIGVAAGLGALAGSTGAEGAIARLAGRKAGQEAAKQGLIKSAGIGVLKESPVEAIQGGQERYTSNVALQREGFDTPTFQGVAGQAALEGLASAPMGGGFGAMEARSSRGEQPAATPVKPSQAMGIDPAAGPLSRAAATSVDSGATPTATIQPEIVNAEQAQADPAVAQAADAAEVQAADAGQDRGGMDGGELLPASSSESNRQPVPVVEPLPLEARSLDELRQSLRNAQDPAIRKTVAAEIRRRRESMPDPLSQPQQEPTSVIEAVKPVETGTKEPTPPATTEGLTDATQAEAVSPMAQPTATATVDEGDTGGGLRGQAGATRVAESSLPSKLNKATNVSTTPDSLRNGSNRRSGAGPNLSDAGMANDVGVPDGAAGAATPVIPEPVQSSAGEQPASGQAALRPERWRQNALQAGKVARQLGLDPKGKRLAQIVAEIDAKDGDVQNAPQAANDGKAKAAPVEASTAARGDAASNGAVSAAPGAGDVQADGVTQLAEKAKAAQAETRLVGESSSDMDELQRVSEAEDAANERLSGALESIPDDRFGIQANTTDGRQIMLTPSAQNPGQWQLTRFSRDGAPWGDSQYTSKKSAVLDFLREVDIGTLDAGDYKQEAKAPAPEPQKPKPAPAKKPVDRTASLRKAEWKKNPLRSFLGQHGLSIDLAKEFAPGITERRKAMVGGYGPIFRKAGKNLDLLAEIAREEGFISADQDATDLYELVAAVFRGERVAPMFTADAAQDEMQARMDAMQEQSNAEFEDFIGMESTDPFGTLNGDEIAATGYDAADDKIKAEVDALIAMADSLGIDTETIREDAARETAEQSEQVYYVQARRILTQAIAQSTGSSGNNPVGETRQGQREEAKPRSNADRGTGTGSTGEQSGLTAPTRKDIEAQQDRTEQAEKAKIAADKAADAKATKERERSDIKRMSESAADTFELGGDAMANLTGQQDVFGAAQPERFEAGKILTKEQRKTVLASLVDVYKQKGADRELKGVDKNGNERYGYVHSPDLFEKSDITGSMVRYYVTMPDGRMAHPTELFPDYTQSDIDSEMQRRKNAEKRNRQTAREYYLEKSGQFGTKREAAEYWNEKSDKSSRTASGKPTIFDALEREFLTDGKKFVMVPETLLKNEEMMEAIRAEGWDVVKATAEKSAQPKAEKPADAQFSVADGGVTESEAFKKWFGDSKVVDADGKPLVVFHGTTGDIKRFDSAMQGQNTGAQSARMGFFFTNDVTTAESYANYSATDARIQRLIQEADKAEQRGDWDTYDSKVQEYEALDASFNDPQNRLAGQNVLPVYLSLQNPMIVDANGENAEGFDIPSAIKRAKRGRHDGLVINNLDDAAGLVDRPASHYVVFNPAQVKSATGNRGTFDPANPDIRLDAATGDSTQTTYTPAPAAQQKAVTDFADRLSKNRDSFVLMDAVKPSGARQQEAQAVANLAKTMFGREAVFVKFKGRPLFNGAVSTTDPGKIFVNIESARPMMAVLGHELLHELRKSNPAAYNQLAKTLKTVTKDDYIYEALLKKKYRDQGLNWTPQDISEELYGDIVGDNFMDPKFWEAIAGDKPIFAKQLYRAVMNWLDKIASMFKRVKVRQDGSMVLTLAEQADGSRPFGTQKYLQDIEAARAAVAQAMGQFKQGGKGKDSLAIADRQDQTETPAFKKWFGESKVVDSAGKPLVVYHGTTRGLFSEFKLHERSRSNGFVFTSDRNLALTYSGQDNSAEPGQRNPTKSGVYETFLSLQNPKVIDWEGKHFSENGGTDAAIQKARDEGYDGLIMRSVDDAGMYKGMMLNRAAIPDGTGVSDLYVTFRPEQIKSATGNRGTFDPSNPDIRFSIADAVEQSWGAPEKSKVDDLIYKLQDKQIDTKRVVQSIREAGGRLNDAKNVYLQEELFHGRAAARTEAFVNKELAPLINMMRLRGIDIAALDEYLHARHAEEANKLIADRNPEIPDGGSGMTTKAAREYLANLDPKDRAKFEAVAEKVDNILAATRQMYADYGLESQDKVDGWGKMFDHYVPLMREDKDGGMGIGQGFSIKGKEVKGRTGSTRKVVDILANIAMQRERAIVRGEKNRVATALVGLAKLNPNKDFWQVGPPPANKVYDPESNSVVERQDPMFKNRDNVVVAKIKAKNGMVLEQAVTFNEDNERAMRMAAALKNLDAAGLEGLLGVSAKITRYFAAINTQYNPIFGAVNLVRDVQGALLNLTSTPLKGKAGAVAKYTASALKGIYVDARAARDGKTPKSQWASLWEEFQNEGGQTGFRDLFTNSADRAKAIERELNPTAWMDSPLGQVFTANGALKVPLSVAQKKATGMFDWLSDYNLAMENAVRLASYKAALDQGMSKQQAASLAKNLTVNFNRKGQVGQQAGALYAFFNASMQGTARLGQTLFDMEPGQPKTLRLSKTGKKIVYGGIMLGSMQAMLLAAAGFDEDEPPEFVRERSLIIPTGGNSYVTIPMPLGLHVLPNLGRIPTEFAMGGFKNPAQTIEKLLVLVSGAFNPIGGGASLVQMLAPTAVDPMVAIAENKDWTGKPIAKTSHNSATPGHLLTKDTASAPAKLLSEAINFLSGGTEYTAGVLSPTPDQIDYLFGQVTGGVGREVSKVQQAASATVTGEDLPIHKVPLVGRFYGDTDTQSAQSGKFYSAINALNIHEAQIKGLRKDGRSAEASEYMRENPEARLFMAANAAERDVQKLRALKRELVKNSAPADQVRVIEQRINDRMTRFNEAVKRLREQETA